jgi:hypothetical protein
MGPRPSTVTGVDLVMRAKLNLDIDVKVKAFRGHGADR